MGAVVPLRFKGIRQPGENHRHIGRRGGLDSLFVQIGNHRVLFGVVPLRIGHLAELLYGLEGAGDFMGIDMGAAAALIAGRGRKFADKRDLFLRIQRQNVLLVAQQHHALRGRFAGQRVIPLVIENNAALLPLHIAVYDLQNPLAGRIQHLFIQRALFHGADNLFVPHRAAAGHFQLQPGFQAVHTLVHGAPVAHHIPVKAPFVPQNLG